MTIDLDNLERLCPPRDLLIVRFGEDSTRIQPRAEAAYHDMRNALPALLAVARAAVAWEEAQGVVSEVGAREEVTRHKALLAAVRALKETP